MQQGVETGKGAKGLENGIIIPLPKKGDIRESSNWRGITLLSTLGKIMATPGRSSKGGAYHQPRQDKGHENRKMVGAVIEEVSIEEMKDFCYLGSVMSSNSSCNKDIKTCMGKASAVFGRLERIWKSNGCSIDTKVRLYESIVLSTLLYRAETWPITVIKWQETGGSASQMDEEDRKSTR